MKALLRQKRNENYTDIQNLVRDATSSSTVSVPGRAVDGIVMVAETPQFVEAMDMLFQRCLDTHCPLHIVKALDLLALLLKSTIALKVAHYCEKRLIDISNLLNYWGAGPAVPEKANKAMTLIESVMKANRPTQIRAPRAHDLKNYNVETITHIYQPPSSDVVLPASAPKTAPQFSSYTLPAGWQECFDTVRNRVYYQNHFTQETQWEHPNAKGLSPPKVQDISVRFEKTPHSPTNTTTEDLSWDFVTGADETRLADEKADAQAKLLSSAPVQQVGGGNMPEEGWTAPTQSSAAEPLSEFLNSEERSFFAFLFSVLDRQCGNTGKVSGPPLESLMQRSGLSATILSQIRTCSDQQRRGYWEFYDFTVLCRLIMHGQQNLPISVEAAYGGITPPASAGQTLLPGNTNSPQVPLPSPATTVPLSNASKKPQNLFIPEISPAPVRHVGDGTIPGGFWAAPAQRISLSSGGADPFSELTKLNQKPTVQNIIKPRASSVGGGGLSILGELANDFDNLHGNTAADAKRREELLERDRAHAKIMDFQKSRILTYQENLASFISSKSAAKKATTPETKELEKCNIPPSHVIEAPSVILADSPIDYKTSSLLVGVEEELVIYADFILSCLAHHIDLIFSPTASALLVACCDGVVIGFLLHDISSAVLDVRALNQRQNNSLASLSKKECTENLTLVLSAMNSLGVSTTVSIEQLLRAPQYPCEAAAFIHQLIVLKLTYNQVPTRCPSLLLLVSSTGELFERSITKIISQFRTVPFAALERWTQAKLRSSPSTFVPFSPLWYSFLFDIPDITSMEGVLLCLQNRLQHSGLSVVLAFPEQPKFPLNDRLLNIVWLVLFLCLPTGSRNIPVDRLDAVQLAINSAALDPCEPYKMWMNSIRIKLPRGAKCAAIHFVGASNQGQLSTEPGVVFVSDIAEDMKDGLVFLSLLHHINPGLVSWNAVDLHPGASQHRRIANCNAVVEICRKLQFSMVGIDGSDIANGNQKFILALLEQLLRYHIIQFLDSFQRGGRKPVLDIGIDASIDLDSILLNWANQVLTSGEMKNGMRSSVPRQFGSFHQKGLGDCLTLLDLLYAMRPKIFRWTDVVTSSPSREDCLQNALLVVSVAKKIGCTVFTRPEHIVEGRGKTILLFVATLMTQDLAH